MQGRDEPDAAGLRGDDEHNDNILDDDVHDDGIDDIDDDIHNIADLST